ncbi:MAG: glycosyltransferase [Candidatus Omnitrophota bacterium]
MMQKNADFSVLISVYSKENSVYLSQSLESIYQQTLDPSEIVLIKDGILTQELDRVAECWKQKFKGVFKYVNLDVNSGLALALSEGLKHCSYDLVARMDADDIARPDRFEKQIQYLLQNDSIDVVGSWMSEFIDEESNIIGIRKVPQKQEDIIKFARFRNPFNHPTVFFRKTPVLNIGGYERFDGFEDYLLWVKMLMNGCRFANIPECLVNARVGRDMVRRRGGWKYIVNEINLQRRLLHIRFINPAQFIVNISIRFLVRLVPLSLRQRFYGFMRKI